MLFGTTKSSSGLVVASAVRAHSELSIPSNAFMKRGASSFSASCHISLKGSLLVVASIFDVYNHSTKLCRNLGCCNVASSGRILRPSKLRPNESLQMSSSR